MGPHCVVWSSDEDLMTETCWLTTGLLMIQPLKGFLIFLFSFDTCLRGVFFFPLSNWGSKDRGWRSLYRLKPMEATWFVILGYKNIHFWSAWTASGFVGCNTFWGCNRLLFLHCCQTMLGISKCLNCVYFSCHFADSNKSFIKWVCGCATPSCAQFY